MGQMGYVSYYWNLYGTLGGHQSFTAQGWAQIPEDIRGLFPDGSVWFPKCTFYVVVFMKKWEPDRESLKCQSVQSFVTEYACDEV